MNEQQFNVASRISGLIHKFLCDTITDDELTEMYSWVYSSKENQELFEEVVYSQKFQDEIDYVIDIDKAAALRSIRERLADIEKEENVLPVPLERQKPAFAFIAVAASILILISIIGYFYLNAKRKPDNPVITSSPIVPPHDLLPGTSKATLTLASGQVVTLGTAHEKDLGVQGAANVKELAGGKLNYTADGQVEQNKEIAYNTLVTPRAGQFQVVLSDGTKVWLNNASSLRYPASFIGATRGVQLQGEAYFEVSHNVSKPFVVKTANLTIRDMGTTFNAKAYSDDKFSKITLVEGGVKVGNLKLKPGQQTISEGTIVKLSKKPNIEQALAWKNGNFQFDHTDIKEVMHELSRWYAVDKVIYEGKESHRSFSGTIPRDYNAADVLKLLEMVDVHFHIEGKTIIVTD